MLKMMTVLAAASCLTALGNGEGSRMDRSKLLIGAYCLQPYARSEAHVRDVKECGVDFITCMDYDRAALDLFAKYGLKAIVNGVMPGWWGGDGEKAGQLCKVNPPDRYATAVAAYKDHPAVWMLDIGDEPSALDFPYYGDVVRDLRKRLPNMPLYLNLYPNYASVVQNTGAQTVNQLGTKTYAEHLDVYAREVPLDYLSYDFYVYSAPTNNPEAMIPKMFENFRNAADVCRRTGRSFWYIPQVNSRHASLWMSENMLRYQAHTALSFGAEVINWACWTAGWWTNQVVDASGARTRQYDRLKKVNGELRRLGAEYMRYRSLDTAFVGFDNAAANWLKGVKAESRAAFANGFFEDVKASNGAALVVGDMCARDGSGGRALFVTAVDDPLDRRPATFELTFRCDRAVRVLGGGGPVSAARDAAGVWHVPFASNGGLLVMADL